MFVEQLMTFLLMSKSQAVKDMKASYKTCKQLVFVILSKTILPLSIFYSSFVMAHSFRKCWCEVGETSWYHELHVNRQKEIAIYTSYASCIMLHSAIKPENSSILHPQPTYWVECRMEVLSTKQKSEKGKEVNSPHLNIFIRYTTQIAQAAVLNDIHVPISNSQSGLIIIRKCS